tara:strand:- start:5974 stop:6849 length:876 start_codon:yes stop_codon:yes gene_type:complete
MLHLYRIIKYKFFNNFISVKINVSYHLYILIVYFRKKLLNFGHKKKLYNIEVLKKTQELKRNGFVKINSVISNDEAFRISEKATELIKRNINVKKDDVSPRLVTKVLKPCDDLNIIPEKILSNYKVSGILDNYYLSDYKIKWIDFYRSFPSDLPTSSWLWHIDNLPVGIIKGIILFTKQDINSGAMQYLDKKRTYASIKNKYYGSSQVQRYNDISALIRKEGLDFKTNILSGEAGDMFLFFPNQLHKAVPPIEHYRDAATFLIVPTYLDSEFKYDHDKLQNNLEKPFNPWT